MNVLKVLQRQNNQRKQYVSDIPTTPSNTTLNRNQRPQSMRHISSTPFSTSKKYGSFQNLKNSCINKYNRSAVIYEDDSESTNYDDINQIKDNFKKRYNSLTNLLMSSFRKAKGKKKQSQFYEDDEIPVESFKRIDQKNSLPRQNSILSRPPVYRSITRSTKSRLSLCESPETLPTCEKQIEEEDEKEENQDSVNDEEELDESTPVFLGLKMIDDIIEVPSAKPSLPVKPPSEERIYDKQSEMVYQTYMKLKEQNPNIYSSVVSVNKSLHGRKLREASGSVVCDQGIYSSVISIGEKTGGTRGSENKDFVRGNEISVINKSDKLDTLETIGKLSSHSKRQAPKAPCYYSNHTVPNKYISTVTKTQPDDVIQKSNSVKHSKTFTEQMQELLKKAKSNKINEPVKKEPVSQINLINSVGNYQNYEKYKTLSTPTTTLKAEDDINDLIKVLAKQNDKFKDKFFEYLIIKIWDTKQPINEYLQLNRVMSVLFGEAYHNMKSGECADYLKLRETKNSKVDAYYIDKLRKAYLDSNNPVKQRVFSEKKERLSEVSAEFDFVTVSSLLESLRVRLRSDMDRYGKLESSDSDCEKLNFSFKNGFNGLQKDDVSLKLKVQQEEDEEKENSYEKCIDAYIESISEKLISKPIQPAVQFIRSKSTRKTLNHTIAAKSVQPPPQPKIIRQPTRINSKTDLEQKTSLFHTEISSESSLSTGNITNCTPDFNYNQTKEIPHKWADSIVKSLMEKDREMRENHYSSLSYSTRSGMQAINPENKQPKTRVKNLLDIFKNINETHSQPIQSKPVKKLEQCFSNTVGPCLFTPSNEFVPVRQLRVRLDQWNSKCTRNEKFQQVNGTKKVHQKISDLIAEKVYRFEGRDMLQAIY